MLKIKRMPGYWFGRREGYQPGWLVIILFPPGTVLREPAWISLFFKVIYKRKIKKIEEELKNIDLCMTYWSHGEMGFRQTPEEIKELEAEEKRLQAEKEKLLQELSCSQRE
ncbi:MAG: hypothetical protein PHZ22_05400 [Bacteroidales bacterium]|nr:hypothetical protein [Bacteroidales bacterium]